MRAILGEKTAELGLPEEEMLHNKDALEGPSSGGAQGGEESLRADGLPQGRQDPLRVPVDLDEPFEMVSWTGGAPSPARRSAPARQADSPRVTPPVGPVPGDADVSALQLESAESAEVVVVPETPASPGAVNI